MPTVNLAVPEELKNKMDKHAEINWSEVARQAFKQKLGDLELLDSFTAKSALTEQDAERFGRKVGEALNKRLRQKASA